MAAAWVGHGAPQELIYAQMCQFFSCTPSQLAEEEAGKVFLYFQLQNYYEEMVHKKHSK